MYEVLFIFLKQFTKCFVNMHFNRKCIKVYVDVTMVALSVAKKVEAWMHIERECVVQIS